MVPAVMVVALAATYVTSALSQEKKEVEQPIPEFTKEFLSDPENIALGKGIWDEQCTHCHGTKAYPGKAPKLRPSRYKPEFIYHRVTYGFRGMPPWEDVYSEEERMAVTAYIKSKKFSP
jgi:mono/diheme cytochrome c family protein